MSKQTPTIIFLLVAIATCAAGSAAAQGPETVEMLPLWQRVPAFEFSWLVQQPQVPAEIDLGKLNSGLLAENVEEARRIILIADREEFKASPDALARLMELLRSPQIADRQARLAFLSATIALVNASEDTSLAGDLWEIASTDPEMSASLEATLAEWKSPVAIEHWRSVVADATSESESLRLAIIGLGQIGEANDVAALQAILTADWVTDATRLETAKALGSISTSGLEELATQLMSDGDFGQLLAAHLLRNHRTDSAIEIQKQIVTTDNALGKAPAFASICDSNRELALSIAKPLLKDPNSNVRMAAVQLYSSSDDLVHLREQGYALRDPVPEIRAEVRYNMLQRKGESAEKLQFVVQAVGYYLNGDFAHGAEEAINLAVALRLEKSAAQMVALLDHPRPSLSTRAAWGLQEIAQSPAVLEQMLPHLRNFTERLEKTVVGIRDHEVAKNAFLMGAFGRTQYSPAEEVLQVYVPKAEQKMQTPTRAAAIWALGRIHAGGKDAELGRTFAARMLDNTPNSPEEMIVKYASALALGMILAPNTKSQLESVADTYPDPLGYAATWAVQRFSANE